MKNFKESPSVYVVYASGGGTTKALAEDFAQRCQSLALQVELRSLNALSEENFAKSRVVFFIGSKGNAEFPENGEAFLDSTQFAKSDLSKMRYAIFALGSRFYGQRSWAGKKLHLAFKSEQACSIVPPVFAGDEFQELYRSWAREVLTELSGVIVPEFMPNLAVLSPSSSDWSLDLSAVKLDEEFA